MNEQNPANASPAQNASSPSVSTSVPGGATNSRKSRLRQNSGSPFKFLSELAAAPPPVIDEGLEDDDIRIRIGVRVISRAEKLAQFDVDRMIYGGVNATRFFQQLDGLLEAVYKSAATKVNGKLELRMEEEEQRAQRTAQSPAQTAASPISDDGEGLLKAPIPLPFPNSVMQQVFAHLDGLSSPMPKK